MQRSRTQLLFSSILVVAILALMWNIQARRQSRAIASNQSNPYESYKVAYQRPDQIPFPSHNPYSEEKYQLGKRLFFDPRLSKSNVMSCATCHNPSLSWTDGLKKSVGHGHKEIDRRAPTLLNVAWGWSYFWDGRAESLEEQALGPIQNEKEMNMNLYELMDRLSSIPEYRVLFERAFPKEPMSSEAVAKAIATYERTIVSDIAPFDQWIAGDDDAISESAKRGFLVFNTKGTCVRCHTGWKFTNGSFADIGLPSTDEGRGKAINAPDANFTFKTPTLRNITRRGPYMHDGSLATLPAVIENYSIGGTVKRKTTKLFIQPMNFTAQEKQDLLAFLQTLASEDEVASLPLLPRREWEEGTWEKLLSTRSQ